MELVPIYRFEYFDRRRRAWVVHPEYATDEVIESLGGRRLPQSEALVHPSRLDHDGYVPLVP
jgi:hypothetical protein